MNAVGHDNVRTVFGRWGHLPDPSFRLLTYMGLVTLDEDDPSTFWQGREAMAFALGRMTPDEPAPSDESPRAKEFRKARESDFRAVKRALTPLFKAEVVAILRRPRPGHQAVYSLHLDASNGGRFAVPTGDVSWSDGGREMSERVPRNVPRDGGIKGGDFYPKDDNDSNPTTKSPPSLNSPGPVDNNEFNAELDYAKARDILEKLPDFGQEIMTGLTGIEGLKNRVIAAADIALERTRTETS